MYISKFSFEMRCGYGEEGSNGTITVKVISREEIVLLLTKTTTDDQIAVCKYNEGRCKKQSQKYNSIYGKLNTTENVLEIIFQNLSRIHLGEMTLSDTGSVRISSYNASCYFNVYAKPRKINCTVKINSEEDNTFHVLCSASRIFPKAVCVFYKSSNGILQIISSRTVYQHTTIKEDETEYYESDCSVNLTFPDSRNFNITVKVFPNITKHSENIPFVTVSSMVLIIDRWNESNKTTAIVDVANLSRTTSLNHRDYSNVYNVQTDTLEKLKSEKTIVLNVWAIISTVVTFSIIMFFLVLFLGYRYITKLKSDSLSVTISTNLQNEEVMTLDNLDIYTINLNGKQDVEDVYCTIEEVWTQRLSFILAGCDKNISNITTEIVYNSPYFKIH
ncbi:uncharacterized protein LOC129922990 isoform X2 [Biomphalaria glabrata]|uniref:Uncharacterized protein LOC129922990 isoform X2 n=1 Tax=Biomphalaria glabrata TaxID=6526 RepID=A0A9W2YXU5_BIOGL|nr:uncharacterized protein LOC129922990 isoform X2 [Biomphalaria glabrata]